MLLIAGLITSPICVIVINISSNPLVESNVCNRVVTSLFRIRYQSWKEVKYKKSLLDVSHYPPDLRWAPRLFGTVKNLFMAYLITGIALISRHHNRQDDIPFTQEQTINRVDGSFP